LFKKYDEKEDKSREGRRILLARVGTGKPKTKTGEPNLADIDVIGEGGGNFPLSSIVSVGEDSKSPRGFFARRKRRRK